MVNLESLAKFQRLHSFPVRNAKEESPAQALSSLREAAENAPKEYVDYLAEAVKCYENGIYRAAILMTWAATIQHLFSSISGHKTGLKEFEKANFKRFGTSKGYKEIRKIDDLLYFKEFDIVQLAEEAGMINRNARVMLHDNLKIRNLCGHPTQYAPGREQAVVFIENLILNIIDGRMINW